jgi:hypothetical protein
MLLPKKALLFLLGISLLGGCTDKMLAPLAVKPVDGYVKSEKPFTYAAAQLGARPANRLHKASPSDLVLHRGEKVLIVKRMDPNWYVISRLGQEYFITYDNVSLSPK